MFLSRIDEQKTVTKASIIPNIVNHSMVTGGWKKESNPSKINKKYSNFNVTNPKNFKIITIITLSSNGLNSPFKRQRFHRLYFKIN